MKFFVPFSLLVLSHLTLHAQKTDEQTVRDLLARQTADWNRGDVNHFMDGYWKTIH